MNDEQAKQLGDAVAQSLGITEPQMADISVTESVPELPSGIQNEELELLSILLANAYGGAPVIGFSMNEKPTRYMVVSTCPCEECNRFRESYKTQDSESILGAALKYAKDRVEYSRIREAELSTGNRH